MTYSQLMVAYDDLRKELEVKGVNMTIYEQRLRQEYEQTIAQLRAELEQTKVQNARLEAIWHTLRIYEGYADGPYISHEKVTLLLEQEMPLSALRDLLQPTIELLDALHGYLPEDDRAIRNEISRLQALTK